MSELFTYVNESQCINITNNCFGHGKCVQQQDSFLAIGSDTTSGNGVWQCACDTPYMEDSNCVLSEYEAAGPTYFILPVTVIIASLLLAVIYILDIIIDFKSKSYRDSFWCKVLILIWIVGRLVSHVYLFVNAVRGGASENDIVILFLFFDLGQSCCLGAYAVCLMVWSRFAQKMKKLAKENYSFKRTKNTLLTVAVLWTLILIILSMLKIPHSTADIATIIYYLFTAVVLLILIIWSTISVVGLMLTKLEIESKATATLRKKNKYLGIMNIIILIFVIQLIIHTVLNLDSFYYGYISMIFFRTEESVLAFVLFLVIEKSWKFPGFIKNYKRIYKNGIIVTRRMNSSRFESRRIDSTRQLAGIIDTNNNRINTNNNRNNNNNNNNDSSDNDIANNL